MWQNDDSSTSISKFTICSKKKKKKLYFSASNFNILPPQEVRKTEIPNLHNQNSMPNTKHSFFITIISPKRRKIIKPLATKTPNFCLRHHLHLPPAQAPASIEQGRTQRRRSEPSSSGATKAKVGVAEWRREGAAAAWEWGGAERRRGRSWAREGRRRRASPWPPPSPTKVETFFSLFEQKMKKKKRS